VGYGLIEMHLNTLYLEHYMLFLYRIDLGISYHYNQLKKVRKINYAALMAIKSTYFFLPNQSNWIGQPASK